MKSLIKENVKIIIEQNTCPETFKEFCAYKTDTPQEIITSLANNAEEYYNQMIDGYQGLREIFSFNESLENELDDVAWKIEDFIEGLKKAAASI